MNPEQPNPEDIHPLDGGDASVPETGEHAGPVDAKDTAETPEVSEVSEVSEVPEAPLSPETLEGVEAVEASESPETGGTEGVAAETSGNDGNDGGEAEEETPVWIPEPDRLLLSLLFASQEYLDARSLREIMGPEWDTPRLRQLVRKLNRDLEAGGMPFEIAETESTWRLRTLPKYFPWTRKLFKDSAPRRLSQAALETLAIVAYKQPVTKAEIESIRGVNVDGSMKTLLDKKLIDIGRRSDALGQAFTYHTTRDFMRYFGISRVPDDLPRLSEFEGILNAQTLLPQMDEGGELREVTRADEEPEQLTLGMNPESED